MRAPRAEEGNWFEHDPDKVPPRYRDMVGVEAYRGAMGELKVLSEKHDFELVVVQSWHIDLVTEICEELDIPLVHFQPALERFMEQHGIERWRGSVLTVSESDPHPSATGHRIYADVIFDHLEGSGIIERVRPRGN